MDCKGEGNRLWVTTMMPAYLHAAYPPETPIAVVKQLHRVHGIAEGCTARDARSAGGRKQDPCRTGDRRLLLDIVDVSVADGSTNGCLGKD